MKQMNLFVIFFLVVGFLLAGWNDTNEEVLFTQEGYVLDKGDGKILVAKNISAKDFLRVKDEFVSGDPARDFKAGDVDLIYITYGDISDIEIGDKVKAWVDGVSDSDPQQARAEKMTIQN